MFVFMGFAVLYAHQCKGDLIWHGWTVTGLWARQPRSLDLIHHWDKRVFLKNVWTCSGIHPAPCSLGTRSFFSGSKVDRAWSYLLTSSAKVVTDAIAPVAFVSWCTRGQFTFACCWGLHFHCLDSKQLGLHQFLYNIHLRWGTELLDHTGSSGLLLG